MKVSILMFVKNGMPSLPRALASIPDGVELIVQDGGSTDGSLDLLQGKVVSLPDSGPSEALALAMNRCTGDLIGSCLADEELMPGAMEYALSHIDDAAAITGDAEITDLDGNFLSLHRGRPFSALDYIGCTSTPYFCASWFRRSAMPLLDPTSPCTEFDIWLAMEPHGIKYVPRTLGRYATHPGQSSNHPGHAMRHLKGRLERIDRLAAAAKLSTMQVFASHVRSVGHPELALEMEYL